MERMELAIVGAARENEPPGGGQHRTPVLRLGVLVRPDPLARVDVPRLNFADVVSPWGDGERRRGAGKRSAGHVLDLTANDAGAQVLVGGNVDHPRLGAEGDRRPVLAPPVRGTEIRGLAGPWLASWIDVRPSRFRIEASEHV